MYELLKNIALDNNFVFTYARKDYANLFDGAEQVGVPHLFVDPIQTETIFGEYGEVEGLNYTGSFMILLSSDIDDESYDYKYQNHIKPISESALKTIQSSIRCESDLSITNWRTVEVINVFDYSMDGLLITYQLNG